MDLQILLALQDFRESTGAALSDFFLKMTFFGELNTTLILLAAIYWCVNKELGSFLLMGWNWNRIVNGFLKITVCAYRPWIRDPRIIPNETALKTATGYSFPSGHSMNGGSLFGGLAVSTKHKGLKTAAWIMVVMVAFSRPFLGVHTPQDVLVGAVIAPVVMLLVYKMLEKYGNDSRFYVFLAIIPIALDVLLAIYAKTKAYPIDYDASGAILVDGAKMANDTFKGIGWNLAFFSGWLIEKKCIGFSDCKTGTQAASRLIFGLLGFYIVNIIVCPAIKSGLGGMLGTTLSCFAIMFYITVLFPAGIKMAEKRN